MKVLPFKIPKPHQDAFYFQIDDGLTFYDKLHQHKEIQLNYIVEGEGTLIVGDKINYYRPAEIYIIGSHISHEFKSDYISKSRRLPLFFCKESFGNDFFKLEDFEELQSENESSIAVLAEFSGF